MTCGRKRRPLGKTAYVARVKKVMKSAKAQAVAKNMAMRFRKTCKQKVDRGGAEGGREEGEGADGQN